MKSIRIDIIPHGEQRYDTAGDWYTEGDALVIKVSDAGDWRFNAAVAVHELTEALLCRNDGVSQEAVDAFDAAYDRNMEPGDDPHAPYAKQHCFATAVERMLIAAFGLSWAEYDAAIEKLSP